LLEAEHPIRIDEYGFLLDTGGAGHYRGALGLVRQYRLLVDDVQVRSDRFKSQPWGLFGGGSGAGAVSILNPGREDEDALPSKFTRRFNARDVLRFEVAGAGGYGPPAERDRKVIEEDLWQGKITEAHARTAYAFGKDDRSQVPVYGS
jgi:N-methylhydantoinase B